MARTKIEEQWKKIQQKYHITGNKKLAEIIAIYGNAISFEKAVKDNPYEMMIVFLGKPFKQADSLILEIYPEMEDSKERCEWLVWRILQDNENEGDTYMDANLLAKMIKEEYQILFKYVKDIILNNEKFYYDNQYKRVAFQKTYRDEERIAEAIIERINNPHRSDMDWTKFKEVDNFVLTDEQTELLKLICDKSVVMLNGSAGTGKSATTKALTQMIRQSGYSYTALAPTGIAAKRLREATGGEASTIHMHLAKHTSIGNFLIIDEMSMVGVHLLGTLFLQLPSSTKIIFICDEAQLCSISCGNIVQDIIDSGIVPTVKLTKVFRYGIGGIATVATDIRTGKKIDINSVNSYSDTAFVNIGSNSINNVLTAYDNLTKDYSQDEIMVLSPFNVQKAGTYAINNAIQKKYNKDKSQPLFSMKKRSDEINFKVGDRVINTENNYHLQGEYEDIAVMNGEIGILIGYDNYRGFQVNFENGTAYLENKDMYKLLLGYAISVHKSQGTQAKAVIVVLDKSQGFFLTRNLVYVAASRAREKLIIVGDLNTLNNSLDKQENKIRETFLKDLLKI